MDSNRRKEIDTFAEKILEVCELSLPVDVDKAIFLLGGEIEEDVNAEYEAKITKLDDSFKIFIHKTGFEVRNRFSKAHELGHLFLHMGYLVDPDTWNQIEDGKDIYFRHGHTITEQEADEFAAAFLMPSKDFRKVAQANLNDGKYDLAPIAEHFKVSKPAALNRGRWLKLFSWD